QFSGGHHLVRSGRPTCVRVDGAAQTVSNSHGHWSFYLHGGIADAAVHQNLRASVDFRGARGRSGGIHHGGLLFHLGAGVRPRSVGADSGSRAIADGCVVRCWTALIRQMRSQNRILYACTDGAGCGCFRAGSPRLASFPAGVGSQPDSSPMKSPGQPPRSTISAMILGAVSFAMVSLLGFAVWALGGRWLHAHFGEIGLFATCMIVFLGASGLLMHPLVNGSNRLLRFYSVFIPAFFAYATVWSLSWFVLHFGLGEWLASLLGSVAFVAMASWRLGGRGSFVKTCAVVFVAHSAGYFLGGKLMVSL